MRLLVALLMVLLVPVLTFARGSESSGGMERLRIGGNYGYGSLPAGDVNNYINGQGTTPHLGNLTNAFSYGGEFGFMLNQRFEFVAFYEQQWAKNPVNETAPAAVTNAGVELSMNAAFAGLNYWFVDHGPVHLAIGAFAGYPTLAHASVISTTRTEYDSQFSPIYQTLGSAEIMLGKYFSVILEGGYQYALLGALSSGSTAQNLKNNGANVNLDMSGWRGKGGLSFHF